MTERGVQLVPVGGRGTTLGHRIGCRLGGVWTGSSWFVVQFCTRARGLRVL